MTLLCPFQQALSSIAATQGLLSIVSRSSHSFIMLESSGYIFEIQIFTTQQLFCVVVYGCIESTHAFTDDDISKSIYQGGMSPGWFSGLVVKWRWEQPTRPAIVPQPVAKESYPRFPTGRLLSLSLSALRCCILAARTTFPILSIRKQCNRRWPLDMTNWKTPKHL
jgi:hypothetical protein